MYSTQLAHAVSLASCLPADDALLALPAIDAALRQLSSLRNALISSTHARSPIQTLPPELLVNILSLSAGPHAHARFAQLSLVCRSWASTIFGAAALWTKPSFHSVQATKTLLRRSGDAPLDLRIDLRDRSLDELEAATLAIKELARVQHLRLTALPSALGSLFGALPSTRTASTLETLSLSNHSVYAAHLAVSHISAPRLTRLALSDFDVSFTSPLLMSATRLSELDISRSFARADGRPPLASLLTVLSNMASLKYLTLHNTLPAPVAEDATPEKVSLSHLSRLELGDAQACVGALLSSLALPSSTVLRITALADPSDDEDFSALSSALASHLATHAASKPMEELKAVLDGRSVRLRLYAVNERVASTDVNLTWRSQDETRPARVIACVAGSLPLDSLSSLTVADAPMTPESWRFLLRRTPALLNVRSESEALAGMFDALGASTDDSPSMTGPLLAPRLKKVVLARASFTDAVILASFVSFVKHWRMNKGAVMSETGAVGAPEMSWTTAETRGWHRDLEGIDLDRCGFVSEEQIAQLKEAGMVLQGFEDI
jgi:hypothetical protein